MARESSPDLSDLAREQEEQERKEEEFSPAEQYAKKEHYLHKKNFQREVKSPFN